MSDDLYYVLTDDRTLRAVGLVEWVRFLKKREKRVVEVTYLPAYVVSTTFIGGPGIRRAFETCVFLRSIVPHEVVKRWDGVVAHYTNWGDAERGHNEIVQIIETELEAYKK